MQTPIPNKKRKKKKFRPSSVFIRMITSYLAVILVSLIVYWSMYHYAFDNMQDYILSSGSSAQKNAVTQIESLLSAADMALLQLGTDPDVLGFQSVRQPLSSQETMQLYSMHRKLRTYKSLNPSIYNILLYYRDAACICSSRAASSRLEVMYDTELGYSGMDFYQWKQLIDHEPNSFFLPSDQLTGKNAEVITYVCKFPGLYLSRNTAWGMVQYESSLFSNMLHTGLLGRDAASCLVDNASGKIILRSDPVHSTDIPLDVLSGVQEDCTEATINNKKYIVFRTAMPRYGLSCVTAFDMDSMLQETTQHKTMLLGILLGALVVELIYAWFASRRTYQPIQDVLRMLPEDSHQGQNELKSIQASISRMNQESEEIREKLSNQQETLRKLGLGKLLGLEPGLESIDFLISDMPANCTNHFVFIIYTSARDGIDNGLSYSRECVAELERMLHQKCAADHIISFDYFTNSTAFILSTMDEDRIRSCISELTDLLFSSSFDFHAGIGLPAASLDQISRSFSEARLAAQEAKSTDVRVVLYSDTPSRHSNYDYSSDVEAMLEKSILAGNADKALGIINNVYWKTRESSISSSKIQLLLNEIYGTLLKIRQYRHLDSPNAEREFYFMLNEIEFNTNLYQRYNCILQAVRYYCEKVAESKNSITPSLCQRVTEYITQHFSDPDLCLDSIAARFDVSPKYLSRHFKEQNGVNLSVFITNIRLKQAGLLLKDKNTNIAQLAGKCGYANTNTFYKAFKRYWGMSPGSFREETLRGNTGSPAPVDELLYNDEGMDENEE